MKNSEDHLGRTGLTNGIGHAGSKIVSLRSAGGFGVDTNGILRATCASKASALVVTRLQRFNLRLESRRGFKLALRIVGLEDGTVRNLDPHKTRGQIGVSGQPLLRAPALMGKDGLDKKHVRESVTDSLVDQISKGLQALEGTLLGRRLRLSALDGLQSVFGEGNGSVSIGFEVDTDIKAQSGVMEMLDASVGANGGEFENLLNVVRASSVSISSLDDANLELLGNSGIAGQVTDERSSKRGNAITVKEAERVALVSVIVDETVGIAIQRCAAVENSRLGRGRGALLGLDIVGSALPKVSVRRMLGRRDMFTSKLRLSGLITSSLTTLMLRPPSSAEGRYLMSSLNLGPPTPLAQSTVNEPLIFTPRMTLLNASASFS